jgi:hypothetical protein
MVEAVVRELRDGRPFKHLRAVSGEPAGAGRRRVSRT